MQCSTPDFIHTLCNPWPQKERARPRECYFKHLDARMETDNGQNSSEENETDALTDAQAEELTEALSDVQAEALV